MNISSDNSQVRQPVVINANPQKAPGKAEPQKDQQKDTADLSAGDTAAQKILALPGKVIRVIGGVAVGTADAVMGIVPSTMGGITSALSVQPQDPSGQYGPYKGKAEAGYTIAYVLQTGIVGTVAGSLFLGGPWMAVAGGVGGLILGAVKMGIDHSTGVMKKISDKIEDATFETILDNTPSGDKMYDAGKNVSEGGILGMKAGVAENFRTGYEKAGGTLSGLWEGTKGAARTLVHREPSQHVSAPENLSFAQQFKNAALFVLALPKNIIKAAAGVVGGVVGATMIAPNGLIEGVMQGADHHGDPEHIYMSKDGHRTLMVFESIAGGAAAGIMAAPFGTILSGVAGAVCGLIVGLILTRIERATDTDKKIIENMENHMKREIADNKDLGSKIANGHRDVIEGAMVGTAAGIREGFSAGYDAGAGVVQGVADGIKGIGKGLIGAFNALKNPKAPMPKETLEY